MANYIVCLAHFCEIHGPSSISCTQYTTPELKSQYLLPAKSKLQTCASCKLVLPDDSINVVTKENNQLGDLKNNRDNSIFISTHYPVSQKRYTSLMKLVMKSLSVETTSDLSKPIFYGDIINGYCINKVFKIKDVNARGGERKYSFMVISDSESELLSKWDIVSQYLNEFISLIQKQVNLVVEQSLNKKEQEKNNSTNSNIFVDNERYLRRSMNKPRSLVELTNDAQIFVKIHLWAVELLKDID